VTVEAREQGQEAGGMSHRAAAWLAWSLWALCVALFALTMVFLFLSPPITTSDTPEMPKPLIVLFRVMALTFPTVGAFVAWQRPKNPIGWILCGTGLLSGVRAFAEVYADFGLAGRPGLLPGVEYMAWFASWMGAPVALSATALLLLVFPDGKLIPF
jgi:two-component system NarL family sensor kinase